MRIIIIILFASTFLYGQNIPVTSIRGADAPNKVIKTGVSGRPEWASDSIYFPRYFTNAGAPLTAKKGDFWRSSANLNTYLWDGVYWRLIANKDTLIVDVNDVAGLQDSLNRKVTINSPININQNLYSSGYFPITIKTDSTQNQGYPDFKFQVTRFDGVNGVDPKPNLVVRSGFNTGTTPPNGQISIEDATEYYYNLNNQNPPEIVAEKHWEFRPRPETGNPTQRWLTFAGRHDGTRTEFGLVSDIQTIRRANNSIVKQVDHSLAGRSIETYSKGLQLIAQTNDITIENNLRVSGLGNIYNDDGNNLHFGTSTNKNPSIFYGITGAGGLVQRLTNQNSTTGWGLKINTFPSLQFIDEATGANVLSLFNGAPNNSLVIRATGNVGVNQSSPLYKLDINGDVRVVNRTGTATMGLGRDVNGKIVDLGFLPIGGSFVSGQLIFSNGTALIQDSNLFFDNTGNKRLGIGTSSPSHRLHISGTGQAFRFNNAATDGFTVSQININEWSWTGLSGGMKFHLQNSDFIVADGNIKAPSIPSYATTAAAAADGALLQGSFFKVTNGNGTSQLHIKD